MKLLATLLVLAALQQPAPEGVALERSVKRVTLDTLGRRREIHRKELVLVQGPAVAIVDLTFGERLVIRTDLKKVWKADPPAGVYSELSFDELETLRGKALEGIRAARARVPGTPEEKELDAILEGFDQFASPPRAELKAEGKKREIVVNGDRVRASVEVDESLRAPGWMEGLSAIGAFPPAVSGKLGELGGVPVKGTLRYVLFLDRVVEQFETTKAEGRAIAPSEFELPPGLTKVPLPGLEPEKKGP